MVLVSGPKDVDSLIHTERGTAEQLHGLDVLARGAGVWRMEPRAPAIVLGSRQPDDAIAIDAVLAAGLEWCRRRSGGGLVLLDPTDSRWIDLVVERGGDAWDDDVHVIARRAGDAWADALRTLGLDAEVYCGPMQERDAGAVACFAGVGAGEVLVGDRKVVGISQRRERRGARVQCVIYQQWDPDRLLSLLGPSTAEMAAPVAARLRDHVAAVPDVDEVLDAVVEGLAALTA